jgi:hypothetical protein
VRCKPWALILPGWTLQRRVERVRGWSLPEVTNKSMHKSGYKTEIRTRGARTVAPYCMSTRAHAPRRRGIWVAVLRSRRLSARKQEEQRHGRQERRAKKSHRDSNKSKEVGGTEARDWQRSRNKEESYRRSRFTAKTAARTAARAVKAARETAKKHQGRRRQQEQQQEQQQGWGRQ